MVSRCELVSEPVPTSTASAGRWANRANAASISRRLVASATTSSNPSACAAFATSARSTSVSVPWRRPLKLLLKNHSIISVTRTKNDSGMVKPSAFAVVLLKTRSNLNGCSMGMSAGFEPRRILST